MNQHTFTVLEFFQFLELVAGYAQSELGQDIIRDLRPKTQLNAIQARRGLYADMLALQESPQSAPCLRIEDIGELLRLVAPEGAVVLGIDLLPCKSSLDVAIDVYSFAQKPESQAYKHIQHLCTSITPCIQLRNDLVRCLDTDGSVLDNASPKLRELRRSIVSTEHKIQRTLDSMVKSPEMGPNQERFVTMRNGRYVVPIRKDAHVNVSGIVHDLSQSGQTLFVEPSETLPLGNDLVRLRAEEKDEVRRILAMLSAQVRQNADAIRTNQRVIAELDAACAISRWAAANRCNLPCFGGVMNIKQAKHPLLQAQFRKNGQGQEVVPLSLELPNSAKTLAITGSNTGGKTVALKTIGLITLIAQSGLPVPASPDSLFTIYENVFADIGDEQSIEANLSTYSGHMANIASILKDSQQGHSLILLDELGSGTDPLEGGAIACGILAELAKRKSLTIATTHLGMVKNFVHQQQNMINAAVRFDLETLRPLYILDVGRPGASHALHVARRIGVPDPVLKYAENMMTGEHLRLEDMLAKMEKDQKLLAEQARQVKQNNEELIAKRDELRRELETLKNDRKKLVNDAYLEASAIVENTRRDMENLIRKIREQGKKSAAQDTKLDTEELREALAEKERRLETGRRITAAKQPKPLEKQTLEVGQKVWVEKLKSHGKIEAMNAKHTLITINVNGVSFTMKANELQQKREDDEPAQPTIVKVHVPTAAQHTSTEINLIGKRVEDALEELESYINQAILSHIDEVRVIHGFGTGRLRAGIHAWLKNNPSVISYRLGKDNADPGGGGCTIVTLRR